MPKIEIVQNKNGTISYKANIYLGVDELTGKKKRTSKCYDSLKKAERGIVAEKAKFKQNKQRKTQKIRFKQAYEMWLENYQLDVKESTLNKTVECFRLHILPVFGECFLDKVHVQFCQKAVVDWRDSLIHYKRIFNYTSAVFDHMVSIEAISENPCKKVSVPKPKPKKIELDAEENFWTKEEVDKFLEQLKKEKNPMLLPLYKLMIMSGIRRGEALSLCWKCIDLDNQTISITQTATIGLGNKLIIQTPKTLSSSRKIQLDNDTIAILKEWKATQSETLLQLGYNPNDENQLVFPNTKNSVMALSKIGQTMNRIIGRCDGLKKITVHGLRHTCCSLMSESGATPHQIKAVLGHSDTKMLEIYTHVAENEKAKATQNYADYLSNSALG